MNELAEYRRKLMERLAEGAREFCSACEVKAASMVVEGDWTLHQVAAHVRDIHRAVYAARARRTLQEENPLFQSVDPDDWMAAHYKKDEPLQKILNEFKKDVDDLCRTLNDIPGEAWSRVSQHEPMSEGLTLQLWVEHSLAHIEEHLNAVRKLT
jgi:hypothetical protein